MNGKLALDTTKKLLLMNIPIIMIFMAVTTVINLEGNDYIKLSSYALGALHLISIVLFSRNNGQPVQDICR